MPEPDAHVNSGNKGEDEETGVQAETPVEVFLSESKLRPSQNEDSPLSQNAEDSRVPIQENKVNYSDSRCSRLSTEDTFKEHTLVDTPKEQINTDYTLQLEEINAHQERNFSLLVEEYQSMQESVIEYIRNTFDAYLSERYKSLNQEFEKEKQLTVQAIQELHEIEERAREVTRCINYTLHDLS